jgi:hypothetical protein
MRMREPLEPPCQRWNGQNVSLTATVSRIPDSDPKWTNHRWLVDHREHPKTAKSAILWLCKGASALGGER